MKPSQLSSALNHIASKIESSKNPKKELVINDLKKILASLHTAQLKEWSVQFSLHGVVTVNIPVDPSWLDQDEDLLPQYKDQVREKGSEFAHTLLSDLPRDVKWELEYL